MISDLTTPAATTSEFPPVNMWSGSEEAVVTVELPGVDHQAVDISVAGKILTLKGSRPAEEMHEGESYHRRERWYGEFSRTIELPFAVESSKVNARFSKGILSITLPRAEAERPKKISVVTD
ncbi:MAG: Hsp20/alpha crystallin family protein [Nitrospiraceae bacterium]|nr:Hsp20/alpha crystallin family protein [Nitrospiraceae bacterium]